jgi:hypothetical protein
MDLFSVSFAAPPPFVNGRLSALTTAGEPEQYQVGAVEDMAA